MKRHILLIPFFCFIAFKRQAMDEVDSLINGKCDTLPT